MTIDLKLHCDFKKGERGRERWAIGLSFKLGHISGLVFLKKKRQSMAEYVTAKYAILT